MNHGSCVDCVCVLKTIMCNAINVTGQAMNWHACDYWIRVAKYVMGRASTGHGCQGHVMTEYEF